MTKPLSEREIVLGILLEVTEQDIYSHIALGNVLNKYQYLDKKERAFITRVTEGTLEHMVEIDYILDQFSRVKVKKMKPVIRNILRSAVYQLKYMDTVPDSAVCNESVKLAAKKGFGTLKGFVNGVLRNTARHLGEVAYPRDPLQELSVRYSMPEWILRHWLAAYDRGTVEAMLKEFQKEKPVTIRCNVSMIQPKELKERLEGEGATVQEHPYLPYGFYISGYDHLGELSCFQEGLFTVQDISSMLVGEIASPKKGDYIIDVCAAPGGKALHLADKLEGTGYVEARDLSAYKVALIEDNLSRMNMKNVAALTWDACVLDEASVGKADIVIADLPCSGLGVLGKKTDLKYRMTEAQAGKLAILQQKILDVVWRYVKPGGMLIYSTCTVHAPENQENVRWFLESHPYFRLADIGKKLYGALKEEAEVNGYIQLLPGIHESDGFFIAGFRRKTCP